MFCTIEIISCRKIGSEKVFEQLYSYCEKCNWLSQDCLLLIENELKAWDRLSYTQEECFACWNW